MKVIQPFKLDIDFYDVVVVVVAVAGQERAGCLGSLLVSGTVEEEEGWEEQVCHWGQIFENSAFNNVKSWF